MSKTIRAVLLIPALLLLTLFLLPMPLGVINIANLFGAAGCALLAYVLVRWQQVKAWLKGLWERRLWRVVLTVLGGFLAVCLLLLTALSCMVLTGMRQPEAECPTVLVLGCQVRGETPSLLLQHRIDTAAEYLAAHPEAVCIVSGGQGDDEGITEAECMRRGLVRQGIDNERIILEDRSSTTQENMDFSACLMRERGLSQPVLIVTNNFHLFRSLEIARAAGLEACGKSADCEWYMLPTYVVREALGLVKFFVDHL